ncbi:MAG: SDR family NAD(P)-dependent oxidoreductase [Alphaproteobacteria bacterium]
MAYSFKDDVAVVTGAGSGIGEACAVGLLEAGARVVGIDIDGERMKPIANRFGNRFLPLVVDVCDRATVHDRLANLSAAFAEPTVLINNAGISFAQFPAQEMPFEHWERTVDVNVKGLLAVTHAILPGMVMRNRGHIVNLGSVAGGHAYPTANVYGGTKAFVRMFSANLRADLVGTRVRVSVIEPGPVFTNIALARVGGDAKNLPAYYADWPCLEADDIAEAVLWALARPARVQINLMEIVPLGVASGPMLRQKPA